MSLQQGRQEQQGLCGFLSPKASKDTRVPPLARGGSVAPTSGRWPSPWPHCRCSEGGLCRAQGKEGVTSSVLTPDTFSEGTFCGPQGTPCELLGGSRTGPRATAQESLGMSSAPARDPSAGAWPWPSCSSDLLLAHTLCTDPLPVFFPPKSRVHFKR